MKRDPGKVRFVLGHEISTYGEGLLSKLPTVTELEDEFASHLPITNDDKI